MKTLGQIRKEQVKQMTRFAYKAEYLNLVESKTGYKVIIEFKDNVKRGMEIGYILDVDESDKEGVEPRIVFQSMLSGKVSEEYMVDFKHLRALV